MRIEDIDKRFKVQTSIDKPGLRFLDVNEKPFKVYGLIRENGRYLRMPMDIAEKVSNDVAYLNRHSAGGRIRFKTDSPYVAISVKYNDVTKAPHFAFSGSIGFDLYSDYGEGDTYTGTFMPQCDIEDKLESIVGVRREGMRTVTINFPLYSGVDEVFVGLDEKSVIEEAEEYKITEPIVFYGSSITQGGCASRPGNAYTNTVSRLLSANSINLGFSGSAKGEPVMAEYIAGLNMSAFVLDYDHNAPTVEHLINTHEPFFKAVRTAHPDLPVIFMTRPTTHHLTQEDKDRIEVIKTTYQNALNNGDKNVYLILGNELFGERIRETALVDGCHPNDSGFVDMAYKVYDVLKNVL